MKLLFELRPVDHLDASVDYYRDLGLEPLGWPDDDTAMLGPRGGVPTIVLVRDPAESALGAGGVTTWATSGSSSAITRSWIG